MKSRTKKSILVLSAVVVVFASVATFGYGVYTRQSVDKSANVPSSEAAGATIAALARELPAAEGSGMVASKQYPGVFWWHRDGGEATALKPRDAIYAVKFDANGNQVPVKGSDYAPFYLVSGAKNTNWEDLAIDTSTNTIWLGDIGANGCGGIQDIYKIAEPNPSGSATSTPSAHYTFTFPDPVSGCTTTNAEAMFWLDGKLYIFAKMSNSPVYRIDLPSGTSGKATLVKLGQLTGGVSNISVSSLSTDRKRLLVASHGTMNIYKTTANLTGDAFVKDIISRAPAYTATFNCNCDTGKGTVEGGSFAIDSYNVAFVSETKHAYYAKPSSYGDTNTTTAPVGDKTSPTVSITAPAKGATVSGTTTITVAAGDNTAVTKVDIYVDNNTIIKNDVDVSDGWKSAWSTKNVSNGPHTLKAIATDAAGNSATTTTQITVSNSDVTAPTSPGSVTAVANSATKVTVAWVASTDTSGVANYLVQRDGVTVGQVTSLSYVDTAVVAAKQYSYVIKAVDVVGNVSMASTAVVVKTPNPPDTVAPTAPSAFGVASVTSSQVNLTWVASTDNVGVAGYKISRNGALISTSQTTSFGDATVQPGTTYTYTVAAYDATGNTGAAASLTVTTAVPNTALNGLLGNYFSNISLSGIPALARTDTSVNFDWASGSPYTTIPVDNFSVRWTGGIIPVSTGTYTFYTTSDDGARLWVNGQQVINQWTDHGAREYSGTIALTAGVRYDITLEYYEKAGLSSAKLQWSAPGLSKATVPSNQLRNK